MNGGIFKLLCPYQIRWLEDKADLAVAEKSRRIGWTWMEALQAVLDCIDGTKGNYYIASADATATEEFIGYCGDWAEMCNAVATVVDEEIIVEDEKIQQKVVKFQNGTKILAGSSNPKFFRSKGGRAAWDEAAFHDKGREMFKAMHATAMFWGYPMRIWSTHNGPGSYFNGLITSIRGGQLKGSLHKVTILDAVEQGIVERIEMRKRKLSDVPAVDEGLRREWLAKMRDTCPDQDTWNEEYLCIPSTDAGSLLSYELISACEVQELATGGIKNLPTTGIFYAGFDVGRKHDLSVLWVLEKVGDVYWTRMLHTMRDVKFADQEELLKHLLNNPAIKRLCIDSSGIGMDLAERLKTRFFHRVEPVTFTSQVKGAMAMPLMRLFQDKRLRVPATVEVREDLHKIRKVVTAAGNVRFEADRDDAGHSDRFWALALAYHAADEIKGPRPTPLMEVPIGW